MDHDETRDDETVPGDPGEPVVTRTAAPEEATPPPPPEPEPPASAPPAAWGWTPAPPPVAPTDPAPAADATPPAPESAPAETITAAAPWAAPAPPARRSERRGLRYALVGGLVGALVGALVAGGLVVAADDDSRTTVVRRQSGAESSNRPATVLVEPGDIRSVLDAVQPAVVRIDTGDGAFSGGTGTGFIIDESGTIVTNAHVVAGSDEVTVHLADGDELEGEVLGSDPRFDLAVVQVDRTGLPTVELGDSDELEVGDAVIAIGNALGLSEGSGATVTTGIVSGLDRTVEVGNEVLVNAVQTDAAINPGNSGGPLLDSDGRVIGINTAIASPDAANNVGFAIAISSAKPIIDDLRAGQTPQIAFLGVESETVTPSMADELGLSSEQGAIITGITSGSAADDAGLERRDVIVEVDDSTITRMEEVARAVRRHRPGDEITVVVERDGERQEFEIVLGNRPDDL